MKAKVFAILGSIRFWIITLGWASFFVGLLQTYGFDLKTLFDCVAGWLGTVAGVGTLDRFGDNIGKVAKE